jgi:hypothetical protein
MVYAKRGVHEAQDGELGNHQVSLKCSSASCCRPKPGKGIYVLSDTDSNRANDRRLNFSQRPDMGVRLVQAQRSHICV